MTASAPVAASSRPRLHDGPHEQPVHPMTSGPLRRMVRLVHPRSTRFLAGVLFGALAAGSSIALMGTAGWLLARAAEHPPVTALSVAVVATRAFGVTRGVSRYLERLISHDAALRALADVRSRVYERLARTEAVRRFRSADLVSRLVNDVDSTQDLLVRGLTPPLVAAVAGALTVVVCTVVFLPGGVALAVGLVLAAVAVPTLAAAAGHRAGQREAKARADLTTSLVDAVHGAPDLVAYGAMDGALRRVEEADAELTRIAAREARVLGVTSGALTLLTGVTVWAVLMLGVAGVEGQSLTGVSLALLVLTALAAFEIATPLPAVTTRLSGIRASASRLFETLDVQPNVAEPAPADAQRLTSGPHELVIRDLAVRYTPTSPWALRQVDLRVAPQEHVALVGPSGAGKSTLANVLLRFRDPDRGRVLLGDVPLDSCTVEEWRRAVVGVDQDPHIFTSTLRANLTLAAPDADDAALWDVLEQVRLAQDVRDMPDGLGTHVGELGHTLSGGMRQRLAVARALLTRPTLLVLDEPTAHVDPDTRDALMTDVRSAANTYSLLVITHDMTQARQLDRVCVLEDGVVTHQGPPEDVLPVLGASGTRG